VKKAKLLALGIFSLLVLTAQSQSLVQEQHPDYAETMAAHAFVVKTNRFTDNLINDTSASLPIGIRKNIGNSIYIIAIDSARFLPGEAKLSAFMAVSFPGSPDTIAFAAKNIGFNPKGILSETSGNSRLMLVSRHIIRLGPKVNMLLENDGNNYVEWNCNGFQAIHLKGHFLFNKGMLEPENPTDSLVNAAFEIHTNDIHNVLMAVSISPFKIKGINDLSFTVTDAVADFSEYINVPGMLFPLAYQHNTPESQNWKGFYLKNLQVKLPQELSKKNHERTSINVNNLLIDNTGVSGVIGANNILQLQDSEMEKWKFSITNLQISLVQNKINAGNIAGLIQLPINENSGISYTASIFQNYQSNQTDYLFAVSPVNDLQAEVLSAKIDLFASSQFIIQKTNAKLTPSGLLHGRISFNHQSLKTTKLDFQNLHVTGQSPYIHSGIFAYSGSGQNRGSNFPISINNIQLVIQQSKPSIAFNLGLNFMNASDQGFSSNVLFTIQTKTINTPVEQGKLTFDKLTVGTISLNVNTQAFSLEGSINQQENHPIYGNFFSGNILFKLQKPEFNVSFSAIFGSKATYRYFYVDGSASIQPPVPLSGQIKMNRVMGGIYYHMNKNINYVTALQPNANYNNQNIYVPDSTKSIGFKGGITAYYAPNESAFNADLSFDILFNSPQHGGGIAMMQLNGDAFSMSTVQQRLGKRYNQVPIGANANISFDFNNSILHGVFNFGINMPAVTGNVNSAIHFDLQNWYIAIGKPSLKGTVNVAQFATISGYFMTGNQIESPGPLPYQIAQHFGSPNNRNTTGLSSGQGFCMGAELSGNAGGAYGFSFFSVYGNVNYIIGFDLMMQKVNAGFVCSKTGDTPGMNGYYISGNLYAYFNASVGVRGKVEISGVEKNFDINIFSATAAASLYGELVKPTYVEGNIYASYNILSVVSGNLTFNFKKGQRCVG